MNHSLIPYTIAANSNGSPNIVAIVGTIVGIFTDSNAYTSTTFDVYTSTDGVNLHDIGINIDIDVDMLWAASTNSMWIPWRTVGPYFALDGHDEALEHNLILVCRGVII